MENKLSFKDLKNIGFVINHYVASKEIIKGNYYEIGVEINYRNKNGELIDENEPLDTNEFNLVLLSDERCMGLAVNMVFNSTEEIESFAKYFKNTKK